MITIHFARRFSSLRYFSFPVISIKTATPPVNQLFIYFPGTLRAALEENVKAYRKLNISSRSIGDVIVLKTEYSPINNDFLPPCKIQSINQSPVLLMCHGPLVSYKKEKKGIIQSL
jgi:hypothetical protein